MALQPPGARLTLGNHQGQKPANTMRKTALSIILLLPLLQTVHASDLNHPGGYRSMAESMADLFDAFASTYGKRPKQRSSPPIPPVPGEPPAAAIGRRLSGSWLGQNGDVLVMRGGRFRLYRDRERYREGRVLLHNEQRLSLIDLKSHRTLRFEYTESEGRLALRDPQGRIHLYKRIAF